MAAAAGAGGRLRCAAAIGLTAASLTAAAAPVDAKSLAWPEVAAEATLTRDGTALVEERLVYRFDGDWRGRVQTRSLEGLEALADTELLEGDTPGEAAGPEGAVVAVDGERTTCEEEGG